MAQPEQTDDYRIMESIAARDSGALKALYDRHAGLVFTLCHRVLRDRNDAEDLLVDVFQELWDKADRFDGTRGSPVTYLVNIARCRAIDRLRARPRATAPMSAVGSDPATPSDPSDGMVSDERRVQVAEALDKLDAVHRTVIEQSFYDGLSHSEIAERMNKPLGTVKTYIRQGLMQLRESLRRVQGAGEP